MPITINPVQPPNLMPPPDGIEYNASLGDNAYRMVQLTQHDGEQAHFDIPGIRLGQQATFDLDLRGQGKAGQGLRITLGRAAGRIGTDSNGYTLTFESGAARARIVDASDEIQLRFPDATALSAVKTAVDAVAGLSSVYFGGEDGTSAVADYDDLSDVGGVGGTDDAQSFDLGLRVTLERGTGRMAIESNAYTMTFAAGTAAATIDDTDDEVQLVFPDASLLSAVKTTVDAVAGLSSVYFGGEDGTSAVADFDALDDFQGTGATHDRAAVMRIVGSQSMHAFVGTAAPANHTRSRLLRSGDVDKFMYITPGDRLWLQRQGSTDVSGSAELWVIEGGG